jgi:acyl-coenzyme A synthetase/AMP-(fatty) acid ligase
VVPREGAVLDEQKLISEVKRLIDPYKAPKSVVVTDALPRTSTGKVQKNVVRDRLAGHYGSS